jgi:hypothetical protein
MDADGDGQVTFDEWHNAITSDAFSQTKNMAI